MSELLAGDAGARHTAALTRGSLLIGAAAAAVGRRPVIGVLTSIAAIAVLMTVGSAVLADRVPEAVGHGIGHAFVGVPVAIVLVAALRWWPPARSVAPGRMGRRVVIVGLGGVAFGQLLEIVGARVDEPDAAAFEAVAHTAGMVVTNLSMLALVVGAVLGLVAGARDDAVPRWIVAVVGVVLAGVLALMSFGAPGS